MEEVKSENYRFNKLVKLFLLGIFLFIFYSLFDLFRQVSLVDDFGIRLMLSQEDIMRGIRFGYFYFFVKVILVLFFAFGVFKGIKWIIFLSIVFFICNFLYSLFIILMSSVFLFHDFLNLSILVFLVYLSISCLNHPFYNQKINKT